MWVLVDPWNNWLRRKDFGLDRSELGSSRTPRLGRCIAREREERIAMPNLGGREARVQRAIAFVGQRQGEHAEPLGRAPLDHREHEQPIEQPLWLALADVIAKRDRVVVAVVERRRLLAALHELRDLDDVASLVVREARHGLDEIGALRIALDQRQRGRRRLALAVQVIGVHGIEIRHRDLDPPTVGRDEWKCITQLRDHGKCVYHRRP
jgi:hypothetical protein